MTTPATSATEPPAHRRRAHPAPDPQLPGGGAALRLRPPGGARPAPAHRVAAPPGAAAGRAGAGHADRPVRALPPAPRAPARRAGCCPRSSSAWCTTMRRCAPSATARRTGAATHTEPGCRATRRPGDAARRRGRHDAIAFWSWTTSRTSPPWWPITWPRRATGSPPRPTGPTRSRRRGRSGPTSWSST